MTRLLTGLALVAVLAGAIAIIFVNRSGGLGGATVLSTLNTPDHHSLSTSPAHPQTVFFGHHGGVKKSADSGRTWQDLPISRDAMGMVINPKDPDLIYIAGHDVFARSTDGSKVWQSVRPTLPGTDIHGFAMSSNDPKHLYSFVVGAGLFESSDSAQTWQPLPGHAPEDIMGMTVAPGPPETLFISTMRQGVLRSTDGGQTWASAGDLPAGGMGLAASPADPKLVYVGTGSGVYRSDDLGVTWRPVGLEGVAVAAVATSDRNPQVVQVVDGNGRVYRSNDAGATWNGE